MKNKLFFLVLFVLISSVSFAQQINLHGKILNKVDVEGIHILNKTSMFNTISNSKGEFIIGAKVNDTLLFSSISFKIEERIITQEIYDKEYLVITLSKMVNQLEEVVIGNTLTGNISADIKNIKTEEEFNFDDVGIPGFKGIAEERIVPRLEAFFPTNVNIEAVYKYISGYYKKLKTKRKWTKENFNVAEIMNFYGLSFFEKAYQLPQNRVYDFLLFCFETSTLQNDFKRKNYAGVLEIFKDKSKTYLSRIKN